MSIRLAPVLALVIVFVVACARDDAPALGDRLAINVGGPSVDGSEGTWFDAEHSVSGGEIKDMPEVKGSQDSALYHQYRAGDIRLAAALRDGDYDVTLFFAEPDDVEGGTRVFDAYIEDVLAIDDLDIMSARDGKVVSALTVTVPAVQIADSQLDIRFEAARGEPVLSAVMARPVTRQDDDWELVWSDEFDGDSLDPDKWTPDLWPARKVNDEDQTYTDQAKNLRVEDGHLIIEAHKESFNGADYTSARVHSAGKGDFLYGRAEVRAMLPEGKGTWAAIWMLPSDPFRYATTCEAGADWQGSSDCDAWPNSGEIDIMEHVGYQMGHVHGTVHNRAYYWMTWEQRKGRILLDDVGTAFHVYELEWSPERIDIFVDGALYFTYTNDGSGWESWPYDHAYHLILNLAVGGYWGRAGGGIDDAIFPQRMLVDYARIYRRAGK